MYCTMQKKDDEDNFFFSALSKGTAGTGNSASDGTKRTDAAARNGSSSARA